MIRYRQDMRFNWVVFGLASEMRVGVVQVAMDSGPPKDERVYYLGEPFTYDGKDYVYGYLEPRTEPEPADRVGYWDRLKGEDPF